MNNYEYAPTGTLAQYAELKAECRRKDAYIKLLEQAVEAARDSRDGDFLRLLPEIDFRRLTVHDQER